MRRATTVSSPAWSRRGDIEQAIQNRHFQEGPRFRKATHRVGNVDMCPQTPSGGHQKGVGVARQNSTLGCQLANMASRSKRQFVSDRFHVGNFIDPSI